MGYYNNLRKEMLDLVPLSAKKLLDVGCGEGVFGEALKNRQKCEVWGIEPHLSIAEIAKQKLDKVISDQFGDLDALPKSYFDCIVFNDVLEHMIDPWKALELAKSLLNSSEGVIVASIPNFRHWDNLWEIIVKAEWNYKSDGILDKTHLRFFTLKSIKKLFYSIGFEIKIIKGMNPTMSKKFMLLNAFFLNQIWDMNYLQFAIVAQGK